MPLTNRERPQSHSGDKTSMFFKVPEAVYGSHRCPVSSMTEDTSPLGGLIPAVVRAGPSVTPAVRTARKRIGVGSRSERLRRPGRKS